MEEGMVDVKVAVVVTMEVEASLEVFLIEVITIIRLSALLTEAFFCNLSSNFCHEKNENFEVTILWTFEILDLRKKLLC